MEPVGIHVIIELYGCDPAVLNDAPAIERHMLEAAEKSGATVVSSHTNLFNPIGVSGVVIIAESHITIHTWPEHGYAAVDVFTCGDTVEYWKVKEILEERLQATESSEMKLMRGLVKGARPVAGPKSSQ